MYVIGGGRPFLNAKRRYTYSPNQTPGVSHICIGICMYVYVYVYVCKSLTH
jgi:hypothetical protein